MACCALALGAISWVGVAQTLKTKEKNDTPMTTAVTTQNNAQEVRRNVTNIKDTTAESTTEKPEESTAPALDYKSYFLYPLGEAILKEYSDGALVFSKTMNDYRSHNGTDFTGNPGDPIKAINAGVVLSVEKDNLWGIIIEIDHGNSMTARYCGLNESNVKQGDTVNSGDEIGKLGTIPIESGEETHLHFEVRMNGTLVNPIAAMKKDSYTE